MTAEEDALNKVVVWILPKGSCDAPHMEKDHSFESEIVLHRLKSDDDVAVLVSNYVSHENKGFGGTGQGMKLGLDGKIYLWSNSFVMRINADGTEKEGTDTLTSDTAITGITANADGLMGISVAHFASRVIIASPDFSAVGYTDGFFHGDTRWGDPSDVAVGAVSGDFYGIDLYRNQIVRVAKSTGNKVNTFEIDSVGNYSMMSSVTFGVCEAAKLFIVHDQMANNVSAVDFTDKLLWSLPHETPQIHVDPVTCAVYTQVRQNITVIDGKAGKITESFALQGDVSNVQSIAANATHVFVKVTSPVELFRVYERPSGALQSTVRANVDQLSLGLTSSVLEAGSTTPLNISFIVGDSGASRAPVLKAWIRRLHTPDWLPLSWSAAAPAVPLPTAAGLFQVRVTPGVAGATSLYQVDTLLELRAPSAIGTVSIFSPGSRYYWAAGEAINLTAILRHNLSDSVPTSLPVEIVTDDAKKVVVASGTIVLAQNKGTWIVSAATSARFAPGKYLGSVTASFLSANRLSLCPQPISVGPAFEKPDFKINQYGDYMLAYPTPETGSYKNNPITGEPSAGPYMTTAEAVDAHLVYSNKMATNMYVDRLGNNNNIGLVSQTLRAPTEFLTRVTADNASVAVQCLTQPGVILRTVPGYGARSIEQRAILLYMDAGLPVGTDFDTRTAEQFGHDIVEVTSQLMVSPAFTGWSWAANWWIGSRFGCVALKDPVQIAACKTALAAAQANGTWSGILDQQADAWLAYAVDAEKQFRANCSTVMPKAISGMTGAYRQAGVIPPVWFENADEIDLHYQSEQIAPPQTAAHNLEYQGRPGKPNFAHYEMLNEDGTGVFAMNNQFQLLMRGSKGVGWSGNFYNGDYQTDPRGGTNGIVGAFRTFNNAILKDYAPFFYGLNKTDDVAIVVSRRMLNIDGMPAWGKIGGKYFDQLWEAWNSLFYAGMPASFVFSDDLPRFGAKGLTGFKALVVIGQVVPTDTPLLAALNNAIKSNVHVFYDQTTKASVAGIPAGAVGIPWACNYTDSAPADSAWQDDSAYQRFQDHFVRSADTLRASLLSVVKPLTESGNRQVLMSTLHPAGAEAGAIEGRLVWVYNNQMLGLSPGVVWRVTNIMNQRIPQKVCVRLGAGPGEVVYDVFAHKQVAISGNCTAADLRNLPGRMFAIVPTKLTGVTVTAVHASNNSLLISVTIQGPKTLVPAKLSVSANGDTVMERSIAVGSDGWHGSYTIPVNPAGSTFSVQAVELFSGLVGTASATIASSVARSVVHAAPAVPPPENSFGQHFKAAVTSRDGKTIVLNALNIDENLFGIDAATGAVKWRNRVGHYWAYSPTTVDGKTFTAQGFDLLSSEGMQIYTGIDADSGKPARRFSLPAYPDRACMWAFAFLLEEAYHHAFASGDGWVAAAGDMALAVWSDSGTLLWTDNWSHEKREYIDLVAMGPDVLVVANPSELNVTGYSAKTGKQQWSVQPTLSGKLLGATASLDGSTLVVFGTTGTFVIRGGALVHTIGVVPDFVSVSDDGSRECRPEAAGG